MDISETGIYEIIFQEKIDTNMQEKLFSLFSVLEISDEKVKVAWESSNELNTLFLKLDELGIKIKTVSSENTLSSSIMSLISKEEK